MYQEMTEKIQVELLPIFDHAGVDLVHCSLRAQGTNYFIDILADKPEGGITIDTCAELNRKVVAFFEARNLFPQGFSVEVSSPGTDWPLTSLRDFRRVLNRTIRIFLHEPLNGRNEYIGQMVRVDPDDIFLQPQAEAQKPVLSDSQGEQKISIHNIRKAIQIV